MALFLAIAWKWNGNYEEPLTEIKGYKPGFVPAYFTRPHKEFLMARRQTAPKPPYRPVTAAENFHLSDNTYVAEISTLEFERTPDEVILWTGERNITFKYASTDLNGDDVEGWRYVCENDETLKMLIIND